MNQRMREDEGDEPQADSKLNVGNVNMDLSVDSDEAGKGKSLMQESAPRDEDDSAKNISPKKVPNIRCVVCQKRFLEKSKLLRHVSVFHTDANISICNICGKTFLFKRSFHRHLSTVHSKASLKQRRRRLIQRHAGKEKCSFQDRNENNGDDGHSCNDVALSGESQESNADIRPGKCSQSNHARGSNLRKIKYSVNGKSLPRKRRRKYTQQARPDLCLPHLDFRKFNQYLNHRIKWKYCRRVSRKNKKWKNVKKPNDCKDERNGEGSDKTELTESIKLSEEHVKGNECTKKDQMAAQLNSITELVKDLDMPMIFEDADAGSGNAHESKKVLKKYLPCKGKLKSHQDHSYGKISSIFLNMFNDTSDATNNAFSESQSDVNHVTLCLNNLPEVNTVLEYKGGNNEIEADTGVDSTKKMNSLFNTAEGRQQEASSTKDVTHPTNVAVKAENSQKTSFRSSAPNKANLESLKKDIKLKRKLKKILAVCCMCKEVYSLMHHLRIKQIATQNNGPAIDCPFCKLNFSSLAHLETHITSTHLKCEGKTKAGEKFVVEIIHPDKPVNYQNNEELAFECHCCPRRFENLDAFNSHVTNSHTRANTEHAKSTAIALARIKEILSSEIVETIFGKDSDTIEDNLKQGAGIKTNIKNEIVEVADAGRNVHFDFLVKQENENSGVCTSTLEEKKVAERAPVKKDMLDKLISELGIERAVKQEVVCPYVCMICSRRFEHEHEFILHTEMHVSVLDCREDYSTDHSRSTERFGRKLASIKREPRECEERIDDVREKKQDFFFQPSHYAVSERWSPTNLRVYTRKPKKTVHVPPIDTNINNNEIRAQSDKVPGEFGVKVKTLSEADSTVSGDASNEVLSKESKISVKRKSDLFKSSFTKKIKDEFGTNVGVRETEQNEESQDKLVTSTTKGSSCVPCSQRFHSERDYNEHMSTGHSSWHKPVVSQSSKSGTVKSVNKRLQGYKTFQTEEISKVSENESRSLRVQTPLADHQTKERLIKKTKLWHCRPCRRNFKLIADLIRHKYYYHNDESVVHVCENCTKVLTSVAMANTHTCTNVTFWGCKRCDLKFPDAILLRQHNTEHHYENVGPHMCDACKKNFLTMSMLERHVSASHSYCKSESPSLSETCRNMNDSAISSTETLTDQATFGNSDCQSECPVSDEVPGLAERTLWLHHLKKTSLQDCEVVTISRSTLSGKEQFKCNLCESVHLTKLGIKLHLIKQHKTSVDICSLCSKLYIAESIARHLMDEHMTSKLSAENASLQNDRKDENVDFVRLLGSKQLYSLCEYRKLASPMKNKCFKCTMCYREFLNFRFCRTHYFKIHDIVCVLCNKEFVDSRQATDHKFKAHGPVSSYLWAVQKIFAVILESKKYGATVQEVINLLTDRTSRQRSATKLKANRSLTGNGRYVESHRKPVNSRDGSLQKRTLEVPEDNENFCESGDNFCCLTKDKANVGVDDVSEQSAASETRMSTLEIGEESDVEYTISADALEMYFNVNEENESCGNVFVLMVTEDDLKLYRNNIKELVSRLCLPSKVFSEDYVTELLLNYVQQIGS